MRFSIIIPCHNSEEFIDKALQSIEEQSFTDYETIVILDNCKDSTKEIVDDRTDMIFEGNYESAGIARNEGLKWATGDYILFIDSDDRFLHSEVLSMLNMALKDNDIDILTFAFIFGVNGYVNTKGNNGNSFCNVWSRAWKREAIGTTRFNDKRVAEDLDFCNEMWQKDLKHANWDIPFYYYTYPRKGSLTEEANNGIIR